MTNSRNLVLFEPWHLGDALIACGVALQDPGRLCLACHPRWHVIIRALCENGETPRLLGIELPYIGKVKPKPWQLGELLSIPIDADVVSIRGDIRDYLAAKRIFPNSRLSFSGWIAFIARRSKIVDIPFARGWLPVRNRYRAWASITGSDWRRIDAFYRQRKLDRTERLIIIHVGAQWRVRQFPNVAELAAALTRDAEVKIVAGDRDLLPEGILESNVLRLVDRELVEALRASSCVITNDSGPMHLAALLGCRTVVVSRLSAIEEWIPPGVIAVKSASAPFGYMPDPAYQSEGVVSGWPKTSEISKSVYAMLCSS